MLNASVFLTQSSEKTTVESVPRLQTNEDERLVPLHLPPLLLIVASDDWNSSVKESADVPKRRSSPSQSGDRESPKRGASQMSAVSSFSSDRQIYTTWTRSVEALDELSVSVRDLVGRKAEARWR